MMQVRSEIRGMDRFSRDFPRLRSVQPSSVSTGSAERLKSEARAWAIIGGVRRGGFPHFFLSFLFNPLLLQVVLSLCCRKSLSMSLVLESR